MKVFFKSIRNSDIEKVKSYILKKPELVNCIAKTPPKKDDGQSPLQVAYKTANFEIADYLILKGADINFIEKESINGWKMPVIHDAIRACVFNSRYSVLLDTKRTENGFEDIMGAETTKEEFTEALNSLKKLIEHNVNINVVDSYGNSTFLRLLTDINQVTGKERHTTELAEDLDELIATLFSAGLKKELNNDFSDFTEHYSELLDLLKLKI